MPAQERAAPDYEPEMDETANPGVTPADIDGVPEEDLEAVNGSGVLSPINEKKCNMTEAGEMCPMHGLKECGAYEEGYSLGPIPTAESRDPVLERFQQLAAIKSN